MKHRYSIRGTEYGSDHEVELAQCDSNPQALLNAYAQKTLSINHSALPGGKKSKVRKYSWLRIMEHTE